MVTARQQLKRRVDTLRRVPFLAACTDAELAGVDGLGTQIDVRAGRTLTHEGADGRECFVVIDGVATASRGGAQLGIVGPGSIVGEMALLFAVPRTATVVALSAMRLLVLDVNEFTTLLDVAPCIRQNVNRIGDDRRLRTCASA